MRYAGIDITPAKHPAHVDSVVLDDADTEKLRAWFRAEPLPAADVMLLRDDLADAAAAVRISRAVDARIAQNTRMALVYSALLPLLAAGVLYPLNFVLHPIDSVILMTLFVAWLLSGTARLNSFDPKPASQSEPQKEPAE